MKDIIDSLKIRLNSPLIISFLLSWPIWNWQIVVGLLWYNAENLSKWSECNNYFQLIQHYSSIEKSLFFPLASAVGYTIFYPMLKWGISALTAVFSTLEESNVLQISKKGYVPTSKYLDAVEKAESEINKLSEIIREESKMIEKYNSLLSENTIVINEKQKITSRLEDLNYQFNIIKKIRDIKVFHNKWLLSVKYIDEDRSVDFSFFDGKLVSKSNPIIFGVEVQGVSFYLTDPFSTSAFLSFSVVLNSTAYFDMTEHEKNIGGKLYNILEAKTLYQVDFQEMKLETDEDDLKIIFTRARTTD